MSSRKKSLSKTPIKSGCVLCKRSNEDEVDFGGLHSTKVLQAHHFCLLLSQTIKQSGKDNQGIWGFLNSDITAEVNASKTKQCYYCDEFGATLGCNRPNCKRKFHLPCGLMNRTQHDFESFVSYCHVHRIPSNVPIKKRRKMGEYKCLICMENHSSKKVNFDQLVWADCCKHDVILHIPCLKRFALSAGYFTKCPACNNNEEFISTIKKYGVFVPDRDASWEFVRNAFGELLQRHNSCDVDNCLCPRGRNYKQRSGNWRLVLCQLCGSYGSHVGCSDKRILVCKTCNIITKDENCGSGNTAKAAGSTSSGTSSPALSENDTSAVDQKDDENNVDVDVISISSDSDDHFSEREPESPPALNISPKYSKSSTITRKRKLSLVLNTVPQVAKKKTVYSQNRNIRYEQQVAKKSTTPNRIYSNIWPHKIDLEVENKQDIKDNKMTDTSNAIEFSEFGKIKLKSEPVESIQSPSKESLLLPPIKKLESGDSKNIASIKNIINTNLDKSNCYQFFCSGPLILQCSSDIGAVEIDNNNEVEIVNLPDGITTQKNIPLVNTKMTETIVIEESDDESISQIKITDVCSIADTNEYTSIFKDNERLSTAGIFENRIRSTTKDFFKRSRSPDKFKYYKRMKKIVKIDFKPIDSISNQWCRQLMPL